MDLNKLLFTSITLIATGIGLMVAGAIIEREEEKKRLERLAHFNAESDKLTATLEAITRDLDKKLETAKFWNIVTREV